MTRAKRDLHLVAPLRFYVTQQSRWGDKHVYGARSRFLTEPVLATFESRVWPTEREQSSGAHVSSNVRIDAAARLLGMWDEENS
jgi:DNA helicase II / ATP-dependent DNA helicase PcrA